MSWLFVHANGRCAIGRWKRTWIGFTTTTGEFGITFSDTLMSSRIRASEIYYINLSLEMLEGVRLTCFRNRIRCKWVLLNIIILLRNILSITSDKYVGCIASSIAYSCWLAGGDGRNQRIGRRAWRLVGRKLIKWSSLISSIYFESGSRDGPSLFFRIL